MQRFVSKRSSSSVDLDSSSLDDVRAERAAIARSVGAKRFRRVEVAIQLNFIDEEASGFHHIPS